MKNIESKLLGSTAQYPQDFNFNDALEQCILALNVTSYNELSVTTNSGFFRGEFVQKTSSILILKENSGDTHMKTGKEKVALIFIKLADITALSVYVLE